MTTHLPGPDSPPPLGVALRDGGADVAVYAGHADAVEVCLSAPGAADADERRVELPLRAHGVHYGFVPGIADGDHYGLRVHGPWEPSKGLRHNPAKLLLDPYARGVSGDVSAGGRRSSATPWAAT